MPLEMRSQLPTTPAIYLAIDAANQIQYVGRAVNLQRRWLQHHRYSELSDLGGVRIAWLEVSAPKLLPEIEKALIEWFRPPLNGADCPSLGGKPRVTISLEPEIYQWLSERAEKEGRSTSNLAAFLLTLAIKGEEPLANKSNK